MVRYRGDPQILSLGGDFYESVEPAPFPQCIPRFRNQRWAERVGLDQLGELDWTKAFCRFEPLPDNLRQPVALKYHGHQFRVYNPEIGDGRGFLFAQLRDDRGRLLDLGTKGSGRTPYSRSADGRLTLKGGVREILATEMLEALGVKTSKSFALFETGEELERGDEPSPTRSAVLTRLSHGHIRIGTFQRLAYFSEIDNLTKLVRYCLKVLYSEPVSKDDRENVIRFFARVCERTSNLAASYVASGFVHGVLNSDNISVTGESFDYGPWQFTPFWDLKFTAAYFDHYGLYAFGRQPEAIQWNVAQLAGCLSLIGEEPDISSELSSWSSRFEQALIEAMLKRLQIRPADNDQTIVTALVRALSTCVQPIDQVFFDWRGGVDPGSELYPQEEFRHFAALLASSDQSSISPQSRRNFKQEHVCSMHIEEVEAIWTAIADGDDWRPFEDKIRAVRQMGGILDQDGPAA